MEEIKKYLEENFSKDERNMVIGLIGFAFSFGLGMFTQNQIDKQKTLSSEQILENVKKQFKREGQIEGSWVEMKKAPWKKEAVQSDVYYGGITRKEQGKLQQYEFIADATTGTVIDVYPI